VVSDNRKCSDDGFSPLEHYNTVGYVMVCISLLSVFLLYRVSMMVKKKLGEKKV
jgi:hypothetical protein